MKITLKMRAAALTTALRKSPPRLRFTRGMADAARRMESEPPQGMTEEEMLHWDFLTLGCMTAIRRPDGTMQRVDPRHVRIDTDARER